MNFCLQALFLICLLSTPAPGTAYQLPDSSHLAAQTGAYFTGVYPNLFHDLLGLGDAEVNARIESEFHQLFYGDDAIERVYYPVGTDQAYIEDINNHDVRTEGMSYGMMIAVQLDKKAEFDRIWKWAKTHMQHSAGPSKTYFAWHCKTNGETLSPGSASDGEEWFATALFFASARWGDGGGIYNYRTEAQAILHAMLEKEGVPWSDAGITPMFNKKEHQVVFVPTADASGFTDPSYHLPHFYELWGPWADTNNGFWCAAADSSRSFFKRAANASTGLMPDYAHFDGRPINPWGGGNNDFRYDAWRVGMNVALDFSWFARDSWEVVQSNRLLEFFHSQGMGTYGSLFTLDGKKLADDHSAGLVAANAVACLAATTPIRKAFVEELWNTPIPKGQYRYYDGLLTMMAMLQVSGNFRIYDPTGGPPTECPGAAR